MLEVGKDLNFTMAVALQYRKIVVKVSKLKTLNASIKLFKTLWMWALLCFIIPFVFKKEANLVTWDLVILPVDQIMKMIVNSWVNPNFYKIKNQSISLEYFYPTTCALQ